jgi:ABC-type transport system involved in multi-copper enzyme maturation permease subunit
MNIPKAGAANLPMSLDDPALLAGVVGIGFGVPEVMMVLLGVLAVTQEFRYGTATSTYLVEPRRTRVLVAKWLSLALASVVITAASLAFAVTSGIALIRSRDGDVTAAAQFWQMVAAGFVVMAAFGIIGVAVGALVRNQIAAAVGVLVWMLAVEQIVIEAYPAVGRWMPVGATYGLLQLGPAINADGRLLSVSAGGLVLAAYTAAAVALALAIAPRRDIL